MKITPHPRPITRRKFLGSAAGAGAALGLVPRPVSAQASAAAKLHHAAVGVGGMQGLGDLRSIASHPRVAVTALCDVDANHLAEAAKLFPDARTYRDWREMLAAEGDRIDSVNVTIPDHMHAAVALAAMNAGKHVYCQKPLTHTVAEARRLREAAKDAGVVTQMGNQIQSSLEYRHAAAMIQRGDIGKVREVHAWCAAVYTGGGRPDRTDPVPDSLDWEKWIGVAPMRPFASGVYHPVQWRAWQDFGGGCMGDFGCHILDTPFKALELTAPTSVLCTDVDPAWRDNPAARAENWPAWEIIEFRFPGTKFTAGEDLVVTWYDGEKKPPADLFPYAPDDHVFIPDSGALFIGENGAMVLPHVGAPRLIPSARNREVDRPDLPPRDHYHHFLDACLGGEPTTSHFDYAGLLAETVNLGTIAGRFPGTSLEWDPANLAIPNHPEANALLKRTPREGW